MLIEHTLLYEETFPCKRKSFPIMREVSVEEGTFHIARKDFLVEENVFVYIIETGGGRIYFC